MCRYDTIIVMGSRVDMGRRIAIRPPAGYQENGNRTKDEGVLQSTLNLSILLERSGPTSAGETVWPRAVRKQGIFADCRVDRSRTFLYGWSVRPQAAIFQAI